MTDLVEVWSWGRSDHLHRHREGRRPQHPTQELYQI